MGPGPVGQILKFPASPRPSDDPVPRSSLAAETTPPAPDLLDEVDDIFEMRSRGLGLSGERRSQVDAQRKAIQEEFSSACAQIIRPAMQAFLERMRHNGGGGLLEERSGVQRAGVAARIRLWMSLSGEIIGRPRRDQHPYLELDLDVVEQRVNLVESDKWKGHGNSGPVGSWTVSEITGPMVTQSLVDVLRRAAS
jgi:hypothetical protein